jgi:hypothetical protein
MSERSASSSFPSICNSPFTDSGTKEDWRSVVPKSENLSKVYMPSLQETILLGLTILKGSCSKIFFFFLYSLFISPILFFKRKENFTSIIFSFTSYFWNFEQRGQSLFLTIAKGLIWLIGANGSILSERVRNQTLLFL